MWLTVVSSIYRSFLKREARRFSANSERVNRSFPAPPCSMLGDSESNWQQRITPPSAGLLLHHAKIGKGDTNKFGICSQRRNEHFLSSSYFFQMEGRIECSAPMELPPALARAQRCLLLHCFLIVKGGTRILAPLCSYPFCSEFLL